MNSTKSSKKSILSRAQKVDHGEKKAMNVKDDDALLVSTTTPIPTTLLDETNTTTTTTTAIPTNINDQHHPSQQQVDEEQEDEENEERKNDPINNESNHETETKSKTKKNNNKTKKRKSCSKGRIIIIGSGMAGLCVARELQQRGYNILIIEAQNRIGGRLKSYEMNIQSNNKNNNKTTTTDHTATNQNNNNSNNSIHNNTNHKMNHTKNHNNNKSSNDNKKLGNTINNNKMGGTTTNKMGINDRNNNNGEDHHITVNKKTTSKKTNTTSNTTKSTTTIPIDVGGALIHGITNNPLYTMISNSSCTNRMMNPSSSIIQTHTISSDCLLLANNGWPIDIQYDERISNLFNTCLAETFHRIELYNNNNQKQQQEQEHDNQNNNNSSNGTTNQKNNTKTNDNNTSQSLLSFGHVFDQVCNERNINSKSRLFQWYQNNLELSCGTTFNNLGYNWNNDEPYGYDGDHVAIIQSWYTICKLLAQTLYILYNSPITKIHIVYPEQNNSNHNDTSNNSYTNNNSNNANDDQDDNLPVDTATTTNGSSSTNVLRATKRRKVNGSSNHHHHEVNVVPNIPLVTTTTKNLSPTNVQTTKRMKVNGSSSNNNKTSTTRISSRGTTRTTTATTANTLITESSPSRRSKRIRGEDVNTVDVRRSHRSNKGILLSTSTTTSTTTSNNNGSTTSKKRLHDDISSKKQSNNNNNNKTKKKNPKTMVQVTLQSGITLEADAVVCTVPLGVLKDETIIFDPPLPVEKQLAIQQLGTGLLNKCVLTFTKQFWQDSDFLGIADTEHSYLILNAAKYTNEPVLLFMYGGAFAKEIEEWTNYEVVTDCLSILRRICGRDCVTEPLDYHVTRWGKEPYSRMSFTYVPPGVDGFTEFKAMSQPIYDHTGKIPVLMFAGEHTTPYHPSTIHGAYLSGIREAYRYDCAVEPEANDFLEFTEDNIYERTFMMKKNVKNNPNVENGGTETTGQSDIIQPNEMSTTTSSTKSRREINNNTKTSNSIKSYTRRRPTAGNDKNGFMTLRHRPKTFIKLDMKQASRDKKVAPRMSESNETEPVNDSNASPIRRSQRTISTLQPVSTPRVVAVPSNSTIDTKGKHTTTPIGNGSNGSSTRRSQRTTSIKSLIPEPSMNGKNILSPDRIASSSAMSTIKANLKIGDDHPIFTPTSHEMQRERIAFENRIIQRSLDSFGPNYEYIYKMIVPIYGDNEATNNLSSLQLLEQRCAKLLRKYERINTQRQALVLHYYKSWIATNVAPSTVVDKDNKTKRVKNGNSHTPITNHKKDDTPQRKTQVAVPTPTTTRFGRTSKPPTTY